MKKLLTILLFMFLSIVSYSQTMDFCTGVTNNGQPIGSDETFYCNGYSSCYVYCLISSPKSSYASTVKYYIYKWNKYSYDYEYYDVVIQKCTGKNNWYAMPLTFYSSGIYRVEAYIGKNYLGYGDVAWFFIE